MPNPFVPIPYTLPSASQVRKTLVRALGGGSTQTPPLPAPVDVYGEKIAEPVEPHEEGRQPFFPYRGTEDHGVPSPAYDAEDAEGYGDGTVNVVYDESDKRGTVLDVRVISDDAEQINAFRATQTLAPAVGNPPAQIVSRHRARTKIRIENVSATDGIWIGHEPTLSAFNGYFLGPGASVDMGTTEAVYALSNTGNPVAVAMLAEFTLPA